MSLRPARILIVEDIELLRQTFSRILQQRTEFEIVGEASDGLDAVSQAQDLQPDLILLDIGLPTLNGLEAARRIRRLSPSSKILFVSQEPSTDVVEAALHLGGVQGYLLKSDARRALALAAETVLQGKQFVSGALKYALGRNAGHYHVVQFYSEDSIFLDSATRFLAGNLKVGNPAVVLVTEAHREKLANRLEAEGVDVERGMNERTYVPLDAADTLRAVVSNGVPDCAKFSEQLSGLINEATEAASKEYLRVAICGECFGVLGAVGNVSAAVQLELASNDLLRKHDLNLLCAYPLAGLDDRALRSICAQHTEVYFS